MVDLQKYLNKAETDLDFREKLLQDANQAIKEKFGDELPYKVTCREKLVFEIEATENLADDDASSIAGGEDQENTRAPGSYGVPAPINPYANVVPPPAPEFPNRCWVPEKPIIFFSSRRKSKEK